MSAAVIGLPLSLHHGAGTGLPTQIGRLLRDTRREGGGATVFRRRQQPHDRPMERVAVDHIAASGRHRLSDGDVVPAAGYRRYADILREQEETRELQPATPGQEHRSGVLRWLR
jgi:hypothetical protein